MFESVLFHAGALFAAGGAVFAVWRARRGYSRRRVGSITFYSFGKWRVSVCRASKRERAR
jgi:hypothetical protein